MRKKVILIIALAVLVILGTVFAVLNIRTAGELSRWQKIEIEYWYKRQFEVELGLWADEIGVWYEGRTRYYGTENGYIILFKLENVLLGNETGQTIAGYRFKNGNGRILNFYAYKDGKFIELEDAYEQGLISKDMIKTIWEKYCEIDKF